MEEDKPFTSISILDTYLGKNENKKMLLKIFSDHNDQVEKLIGKDFAAGTVLRYSTATSQDEFNSEKLLPALSNQKMNAYLKEISDLCGFTKNLTFHLARHTFATTVTLTNGVPIESVSKMLGHKSLKTTQHYAKILNRKASGDMTELKEKLKLKDSSYNQSRQPS